MELKKYKKCFTTKEGKVIEYYSLDVLDWFGSELDALDFRINKYGCPHIQIQKLREKLKQKG